MPGGGGWDIQNRGFCDVVDKDDDGRFGSSNRKEKEKYVHMNVEMCAHPNNRFNPDTHTHIRSQHIHACMYIRNCLAHMYMCSGRNSI